jgi:hypothetical protein
MTPVCALDPDGPSASLLHRGFINLANPSVKRLKSQLPRRPKRPKFLKPLQIALKPHAALRKRSNERLPNPRKQAREVI